MFIGTLNYSILHPREIYRAALRQNAAAIILTHNHPSGYTDPSSDDIEATKRIAEAGKLIDIRLLDYVIIGIEKPLSSKGCLSKEIGTIKLESNTVLPVVDVVLAGTLPEKEMRQVADGEYNRVRPVGGDDPHAVRDSGILHHH